MSDIVPYDFGRMWCHSHSAMVNIVPFIGDDSEGIVDFLVTNQLIVDQFFKGITFLYLLSDALFFFIGYNG